MTEEDRREELLSLYGIAVEEYRFQVKLNNQRFQWYTALDVALLTVGTGLLRLSGDGRAFTSLVFAVGAVLAVFTMFTVARQVDYQHRARQTAKKIIAELGMTEYEIGSTEGWDTEGDETERQSWWPPKVRWVNYGLLAVLAGVHAGGMLYVITTG